MRWRERKRLRDYLKIWMAGYAGKLAARAILSSRSLKIEYLKRYVGGLVVFDDWMFAYRVSRFGRKFEPMMRLKASRFVGSCFFET